MRAEIAEFSTELLAIANVVRKCHLIGNKKIAKAIKDSPFTKFEAEILLEFIELFMQGTEKGVIIDTLQMSPELVKKFDKYDLCWQAEQAHYPADADYCGESSCIFELESAAEEIVGKPASGDVFMYLFRRFGYPIFGWDDQKNLVIYRITTPMPGVILMVEPPVTGAFTFGYIMRRDIAETYAEEDRKPFTERYERFEAWAIAEKGIETMHIYIEPDNEKLQRVWQTWCAANAVNDFETMTRKRYIRTTATIRSFRSIGRRFDGKN